MLVSISGNHYSVPMCIGKTKYVIQLLFDTGATNSVICIGDIAKLYDKSEQDIKKYLSGLQDAYKLAVTVANGHKIEVYMCFLRNVKIGDFEVSRFSCLVGDFDRSILGMDFIKCCECSIHSKGILDLTSFSNNLYIVNKNTIELCPVLPEEYKYYSWFNALTEKQKEHLKYHWAVVYNCCVEGNFKDVAGILDGCVIPDYPVGNAYE